ncbi:hypothetical protein [Bradyrhizobium sp. CCBAU 45384]|uniref:hypothetical protein n=1 Tax=Bradyrhizobium sp. CCBAU 45384 TaxID=858428 RepID=UPI002305845A|nr:hypothetical protein [Bradyrhizobium sp. CCBAU 45384]
MFLREGFWPEASCAQDAPGAALAAGIALMALAGFPPKLLANVKLANALPKGKPTTIMVELGGQLEAVRVTPAVAVLIESWKRVRPPTTSDRLFVRHGGAPFSRKGFIQRHFQHLGLNGSLHSHTRRFFIERFFSAVRAKGLSVPEASAVASSLDRYLARLDRSQRHASPSVEDERIVLEHADPFPGSSKRFFEDSHALSDAKARGTLLPDRYLACFRLKGTPAHGLPADHPLRADLARMEWSPDWPMRYRQCADLYRRHRDDIKRHTGDGSILVDEWAELFGLCTRRYRAMARYIEQPLRPTPFFKSRLDASQCELTLEEERRLASIGATAWPRSRGECRKVRIAVLRKHAGFVFGLVEVGKITNRQGARLFRMPLTAFVWVKHDYAAGVFDYWLRSEPLTRAESLLWREFVFSKRGERRKGQKAPDFIRGLRLRYGVPLPHVTMMKALKKRPSSQRRQSSYGKTAFPLSKAERRRLEKIAASSWPSKRRIRFRLSLLREHAAFVFDLVRLKRLRLPDIARLFRMGANRTGELFLLYREGDLALALYKPRWAEARDRMALFLREFNARDDGQSLPEFLREFRRRHRIFIPAHNAREYLRRISKKEGKPASYGGSKLTNLPRPPLTRDERWRLKKIGGIDWEGARDVDDLRREMLGSEGDFLMGLLVDRKLSVKEAAPLINVSHSIVHGMRTDWLAGLFARHVEPPPAGAERKRQIRIVQRQLNGAGSNEPLGHFVVRLGRLGVLLPRHLIEDLRKRAWSAAA